MISLQRLIESAAASSAKVISGVVKDGTGAAKDVTGIAKDIAETKLTNAKLHERERWVEPANFEQTLQFDTSYQIVKAREDRKLAHYIGSLAGSCLSWLILEWIMMAMSLLGYCILMGERSDK